MQWRYLIPFVLFLAVAVALGVGLTLKPREIPSALINHPVPEFSLPPLRQGGKGLSSADLRGGQPVVVNVFASWCVPCRAEHPVLMRFRALNVAPLYGLNYKDKPADARAFLDELGDPFTAIGVDRNGRVGIDWGVYGVPESFVVDGRGNIRMKHIGPLTDHDIDQKVIPLLNRLKAEK